MPVVGTLATALLSFASLLSNNSRPSSSDAQPGMTLEAAIAPLQKTAMKGLPLADIPEGADVLQLLRSGKEIQMDYDFLMRIEQEPSGVVFVVRFTNGKPHRYCLNDTAHSEYVRQILSGELPCTLKRIDARSLSEKLRKHPSEIAALQCTIDSKLFRLIGKDKWVFVGKDVRELLLQLVIDANGDNTVQHTLHFYHPNLEPYRQRLSFRCMDASK